MSSGGGGDSIYRLGISTINFLAKHEIDNESIFRLRALSAQSSDSPPRYALRDDHTRHQTLYRKDMRQSAKCHANAAHGTV